MGLSTGISFLVAANPASAEAAFVSHAGNISPQGMSSSQVVDIMVKVGCDNGMAGVQLSDFITDMHAYYTTNGANPGGFGGQPQAGSQVIPMSWVANVPDSGCPTGFAALWKGQIPAQQNKTQVRYVIETWNRNDPRPEGHIWADSVSYNQGKSTLMLRSPKSEPTVFGYYVQDTYPPNTGWSPEWAKEAIFYHIFVDRFRDGEPANNNSPTKNGDTCIQFTNKGYCTFASAARNGGDLQGIIDALDYLKDLGVTALWLSPIYKSTKYHGYDVLDYQTVEPFFGDNKLLETLVDAAHKKGIRIVLDFVPNHTSDQISLFQDAKKNCQKSPFYFFYIFNDCRGGYATFGNAPSQPKINLQYGPARQFMLANISKWLKDDFNADGQRLNPGPDGFRGIDGYRMDYAQGADPCKESGCDGNESFSTAQSFWRLYRAVIKSLNPQSFTFAENTFGASYPAYNDYAPELDGTLDFALRDALFNSFVGGGPIGSNLSGANIDQLHQAILAHELNFVPGFIPVTFLSNHDQYRFFYKTGNNIKVTLMAAAIQFTLKGAPVIYYGEEVGVSQDREGSFEPTRQRMIWSANRQLPADSGWTGAQNKDLLNAYKKLILIRKEYRALRDGFYSSLWRHNDQDTFAYGRYFPVQSTGGSRDDSVIVAMNLSQQPRSLLIPNQVGNGASLAVDLHLPEGVELVDLLSGSPHRVQGGKITLMLQSQQVAILARKR